MKRPRGRIAPCESTENSGHEGKTAEHAHAGSCQFRGTCSPRLAFLEKESWSEGQGEAVVPRLSELHALLGVALVPTDTDSLARLLPDSVSS